MVRRVSLHPLQGLPIDHVGQVIAFLLTRRCCVVEQDTGSDQSADLSGKVHDTSTRTTEENDTVDSNRGTARQAPFRPLSLLKLLDVSEFYSLGDVSGHGGRRLTYS